MIRYGERRSSALRLQDVDDILALVDDLSDSVKRYLYQLSEHLKCNSIELYTSHAPVYFLLLRCSD